MLAYVNGQYIPADRPALPVNDRSFLYGDGLFETIRIANRQPFLWREHLERLERGADFLDITIPATPDEIRHATRHLLTQNDAPEGFVRIHLSRGRSQRGYSTAGANSPTLIITTHTGQHPAMRGLKLITAGNRVLANDSITQHKTANRLTNILARRDADHAGADEALLLNNHDHIAEASSANIFIVHGNEVITPPKVSGALPGTTRAFILKIAPEHGFISNEKPLAIADLQNCDAVFLTSAHWLVMPVVELDRILLPTRGMAVVQTLRGACEKAAAGF